MINLFLSAIIAYLLGSIPTAYLLVKSRGMDIFSLGTGNPGTANTFRMVGYKEGLIVFFVDSSKGALSVAIAILMGVEGEWLLIPGAFSVWGHLYPVFLRFKGGGGLATMIGIGAVLLPFPTAIGVIPGIMILLISHHTGISSTIGVLAAIGAALNRGDSGIIILGYFFIGLFILIRIRMHIYLASRKAAEPFVRSDSR